MHPQAMLTVASQIALPISAVGSSEDSNLDSHNVNLGNGVAFSHRMSVFGGKGGIVTGGKVGHQRWTAGTTNSKFGLEEILAPDVGFPGQSGHGLLRCTCPLMTQSGQRLLKKMRPHKSRPRRRQEIFRIFISSTAFFAFN
jgi:hypothetical protein